jgi:hypothetical protein
MSRMKKIEEFIESLALLLVLFASCKRFIEGGYATDLEALIKEEEEGRRGGSRRRPWSSPRTSGPMSSTVLPVAAASMLRRIWNRRASLTSG